MVPLEGIPLGSCAKRGEKTGGTLGLASSACGASFGSMLLFRTATDLSQQSSRSGRSGNRFQPEGQFFETLRTSASMIGARAGSGYLKSIGLPNTKRTFDPFCLMLEIPLVHIDSLASLAENPLHFSRGMHKHL